MSIKEEVVKWKSHQAYLYIRRKLTMQNKLGEQFSLVKSGEKFLRGYLGAALCTVALFYIRGKQMPAEVDVQQFQTLLLAIVPVVGGLFDAIVNLIKFLKKEPA